MGESVTGVVKAVRKDGKGFMIGDDWYSAFRAAQLNGAQKGADVTFFFKKNGQWNNIEGDVTVNGTTGDLTPSSGVSTKTYSNGAFPIGKRDGQRSIIRQNALTNARSLVQASFSGGFSVNDDTCAAIIHLARIFEAYTTGDIETEAAEELAEERSISD